MPLAEYLKGPQSANDAAPPPPVDPAAEMRKKVFVQFGALVALGLALAGWYVGYRVFAARASRPPAPEAAIVVHTPVPAPVAITRQPTPPPVAPKPAEVPVATAPVASSPVEKPLVGAKPVVAKPVAANPVAAKPAVPVSAARVVAAPAASAPGIVKAVKEPQASKRKDSVEQPFKRHDASPHSGEKYLQIAAFGPRALDGFLKTLEGQGLRPVVAPGPVDNIYRILVGPFPNSAALEEARSLIRASGIEPILRAY
jgi:cell division septation protein DedD